MKFIEIYNNNIGQQRPTSWYNAYKNRCSELSYWGHHRDEIYYHYDRPSQAKIDSFREITRYYLDCCMQSGYNNFNTLCIIGHNSNTYTAAFEYVVNTKKYFTVYTAYNCYIFEVVDE